MSRFSNASLIVWEPPQTTALGVWEALRDVNRKYKAATSESIKGSLYSQLAVFCCCFVE